MSSLCKLLLSTSLAATGLCGLQGPALAVTTINANVCQLNSGDLAPGPGVFRQGRGITNFATSYRNVYCPVIRTAAPPAGGYSVYVDGSVVAGTSLTCSLDSYAYDDSLVGSASLFVNTPGKFDRLLTLPQTQVTTYTHQVLSCAMPPNSQLFDIEPLTP